MSIDMNAIHPRLAGALRTLQSQCSAKGLELGFSAGYRSAAEQDALYAQGRTTAGSIVTNARGGYSQHNWGIAADFFQNIRDHAYDDWFFSEVGPMAETLGLGWGGRWTGFTDRPHLYLPDWGDTPDPLIRIYGLNGYAAFRASWENPSDGTTSSTGETSGSRGSAGSSWQDNLDYPLFYSEATSRAQQNLNNYVGAGLDPDGYIGAQTHRAMIRAVQYACNADYGSGLAVDGIWGSGTAGALKGRYVEQGETRELVRAVQILLLARGDDPQRIDASFGADTLTAVKQFQKDTGLDVDGVAGFDTIRKLLFVI